MFAISRFKVCWLGVWLLVWLLLGPPGIFADPTVVEIGVIVAQSGKANSYGQAAIQGAQLAVDEINAQGGVMGHRLQLVIFDNQSTALYARQAAFKAVDHSVAGVVGSIWSTHSLAVAQVLQEHHIPMISPGSTAPEVTRTGSFIFRTCYTDDFQGKLMADFAYRSMGYRRAAVLTNISETYSKILARYFAANFVSDGGKVVVEEGYKGSAIDFKDILLSIKALHPEVIFIPGYSQDSGLIIKQARKLGLDTVFLGGDAWETTVAEYAGSALEGSYFSTFWHPSVPYPRSRKFIALFRSAYGEGEISAYAPMAYDAILLFADAIRRAKSTNPETIRDALAATRGFEGATGNYTFDEDGNPINKGASILKFSEGRWSFYKAFEPGK
jgi:branched-chain amino acid transport system substrate-binding protein